MQETPKQNEDEKEKPPEKDGNWGDDQRRHSYYYDDAYGYEKFVDEDEGGEAADPEASDD